MKKKQVFLLLAINGVLAVALIILLSLHFVKPSKSEIVYVDNVELFNDFNMSKDLGKINTEKMNVERKKMDSLYSIYSIFREQKNKEKTTELEKQLRAQDQELRKTKDFLSKDLNRKVWNRLNQYIKEYGETHKYKIVLGTQGNGNVMYAEEVINITSNVLIYANEKYEGNQIE
ncbi:OmpH family outer membrane protein [Aquimarina sp. 2201CG5-10]|uniref:OmpH family outer membrane protein n=1 Tax=Aquimarina callyspongiae TaxID=3098150 RepID=UPI002AB41954|nr:OmpH family outer membrane protein [Aquimarina sp. 2201CG5-10]MDY8138492.1 OmpH family outer membrane protein [Aquimarina sp. 2201CG5-10]